MPQRSFLHSNVWAFVQVGASITADVLILQAGIEIFVENAAMGTFFSSLGYCTPLPSPSSLSCLLLRLLELHANINFTSFRVCMCVCDLMVAASRGANLSFYP